MKRLRKNDDVVGYDKKKNKFVFGKITESVKKSDKTVKIVNGNHSTNFPIKDIFKKINKWEVEFYRFFGFIRV